MSEHDLLVWYDVYIGGKELTPPPFSLTFHRELSHHTVVDVKMKFPRSVPVNERPKHPDQGTPVEIRWGMKPGRMRTWYGYVDHTRAGYAEDTFSETVHYVLVGTGHALEVQRTKDWRNITDSGIAQKIAEDHNLSLVAHRTNRVYEYLMQPGISDLEFLKERGRECGRRVHIENGVLYFIDPSSLAMAKKRQPVREKMDRMRDAERLIDVEPLYGTLVPTAGKQAKRQVTGVDIEQNRLLYAKQVPNQPAPDFVARGTQVTSPVDLYQNVDALNIAHEDWFHCLLTLEYDGDVDALPGQLLELSGKAVHEPLHGLWMVSKSTHHLTSYPASGANVRRFDSELQVSRNAPTTFQVRDARIPAIDDRCTRSGGKWRSATQQVILL